MRYIIETSQRGVMISCSGFWVNLPKLYAGETFTVEYSQNRSNSFDTINGDHFIKCLPLIEQDILVDDILKSHVRLWTSRKLYT